MELDDDHKELISAYVDNHLSAGERQQVEIHILNSRDGIAYYLNTVLMKHLIRESYFTNTVNMTKN
ncbi:MAG: zf-HC2 domain-containing protein [Pseudomonadota bacterium]